MLREWVGTSAEADVGEEDKTENKHIKQAIKEVEHAEKAEAKAAKVSYE